MDGLDIEKWLRINELNLENELALCASYYYLLSSLEVEANETVQQAEMVLEIYEAELSAKFRADAALNLGKATQKQVETFYKTDPKWQELKKQVIKLQRNHDLLHKASYALDMKSKMLMSLNRRDLFKQEKFGSGKGE